MSMFDGIKKDLEGLDNPLIDVYFHKDFDEAMSALATKVFLKDFS